MSMNENILEMVHVYMNLYVQNQTMCKHVLIKSK